MVALASVQPAVVVMAVTEIVVALVEVEQQMYQYSFQGY